MSCAVIRDRRTVLAPAGGQAAEEIIDVRRPRIASHDGRCMSRDLEYALLRRNRKDCRVQEYFGE
jgi:hypothetical protein